VDGDEADSKLKLDELFSEDYNENQCFLSNIISQTIVSFAKLYHVKEVKESRETEATAIDESVPLSSIFVDPISPPGWAWMEIFDDFLAIIEDGETRFSQLAIALTEMRKTIIKFRLDSCRKVGTLYQRTPLLWQKKQVREVKMLSPNFDADYTDKDKEKKYRGKSKDENERQKLKVMHKREMKGAIRELKKDAAFLTAERLKKIKQSDAEYQKKMKRVYGALGDEQGQANKDSKKRARK